MSFVVGRNTPTLLLSYVAILAAGCSSSGGGGGSGDPEAGISSSGSGSGGNGSSGGSSGGIGSSGSSSGGCTSSGGPANAADGGLEASSCPGAPSLYPDTATSEYCLHDSAKQTLYCSPPSEVCCLGANDTSICAAAGTTCPASLATLNCTDNVECGAGQVCCAAGPAPVLDMTCGYFQEEGLTSSTCISGASCPTGLFELCGSTADCATCTPFRHSSGDNLGFCN